MSPLDRNFRLKDDDLVDEVPFFDDLYRYTVRHGSTMIPDLMDYLRRREQEERELKEQTQTFSTLCTHGLPHDAHCELCELGVTSFSEAGEVLIGRIVGRTYGKTQKQRRRWYRRLWVNIKLAGRIWWEDIRS